MNIADIDYTELKPLEAAFLARVVDELSWLPHGPSRALQPKTLALAGAVVAAVIVLVLAL